MRTIRNFFIFLIVIIVLAVFAIALYGHQYYNDIITKTPIETKVDEIKSEITYTKKKDIPEYYFKAVVDVEDRRFYSHGAADIIGIVRATVVNTKNKDFIEGGSTITQQVAKNMYFINSREDVVKRKVAEVFTAIELEKKYSKDDILELYANIIYFGNGYYNISEASQGYFGKEPKDLTLAEAILLAGVPNAPSIYAPTENKELCKKRMQKVMNEMIEAGDLKKEEADKIDLSFVDEI